MIPIPLPPNSVLELPLDWWFLLLEHLSAHEKLNLSHTCKDLRAVAMHEWPSQIRHLQPVERMQFISAFANTSLNHWLSFDCRKLHEVDFSSTPRVYNYMEPDCCHKFGFTGHVSSSYSGHYYIYGGHLQIALKYMRRRHLGGIHRKYLEELLDPISVVSLVERKMRSGPHVLTQYSAQPKITNDRYLLAEKWCVTPCDDHSLPVRRLFKYEHLEGVFPVSYVCYHLGGMGAEAPEDRLNGTGSSLLKTIELALSLPPGQAISLTCHACPTDIEVCLEQNDQGCQTLRMRAWKDMGEAHDGPVLPEEWTSRVEFRSDIHDGDRFQPWPGDYRSQYENGVRLSSLQTGPNSVPGPSTGNKAITKNGPGQLRNLISRCFQEKVREILSWFVRVSDRPVDTAMEP